jgi:hypothetical protein
MRVGFHSRFVDLQAFLLNTAIMLTLRIFFQAVQSYSGGAALEGQKIHKFTLVVLFPSDVLARSSEDALLPAAPPPCYFFASVGTASARRARMIGGPEALSVFF